MPDARQPIKAVNTINRSSKGACHASCWKSCWSRAHRREHCRLSAVPKRRAHRRARRLGSRVRGRRRGPGEGSQGVLQAGAAGATAAATQDRVLAARFTRGHQHRGHEGRWRRSKDPGHDRIGGPTALVVARWLEAESLPRLPMARTPSTPSVSTTASPSGGTCVPAPTRPRGPMIATSPTTTGKARPSHRAAPGSHSWPRISSTTISTS